MAQKKILLEEYRNSYQKHRLQSEVTERLGAECLAQHTKITRLTGNPYKFFLSGCEPPATLLSAAWIVWFQSYIILPSLSRGRVETPAPSGISQTYISTQDGEQLNVWRMDGAPSAPLSGWALVLFHGNGDTTRSSAHLLSSFAELGFTGFVSDYRGTGSSSGWPTEKTLLADADLILSKVVQEGFPIEKIISIGHSFGTGIAAYSASSHDLPAVVLVSPYLSIPEVVKDRGLLSLLRVFLQFEIPTAEWLASYNGRCVIVAHGGRDTVILPRHSDELIKRYPAPDSLTAFLIPDAHHGDIFTRTVSNITAELQRCLLR